MSAGRVPAAPQQERAISTRARLLDAAVDELVDVGYARLSASSVARRAGVSRGAQQRYFPHKDVLVAETVAHLRHRHATALDTRVEAVPAGPARVARALDVCFELYSGPAFGAIVELALAARRDPVLAERVAIEERAITRSLHDAGRRLFAEEPAFAARWATALGTVRGIALLRLLGHPERTVRRQWRFARAELLTQLTR